MYKLSQAQLAEAHSLLEARAKQLAALQHDKDELLRHVETKAQQAEVGGRVGCVGVGVVEVEAACQQDCQGCACVLLLCMCRLQYD
jgi:hypothetical protein